MKLHVRTLNNQGQEFLPVELPAHFLELAFVPDGEEPGSRQDLVVEHVHDKDAIGVRARDGQLLILPKASNSVSIQIEPFAGRKKPLTLSDMLR